MLTVEALGSSAIGDEEGMAQVKPWEVHGP